MMPLARNPPALGTSLEIRARRCPSVATKQIRSLSDSMKTPFRL
jgi:hypothetical protein